MITQPDTGPAFTRDQYGSIDSWFRDGDEWVQKESDVRETWPALIRIGLIPCPCGVDHPLADHQDREMVGWHPVFGDFHIDDVIYEHAQGEHETHPDPEACPACH